MKTIALYAKEIKPAHVQDIQRLLHLLKPEGFNVLVSARFAKLIKELGLISGRFEVFHAPKDILSRHVDLFVSIGGDGTFLDGVKYIFGSKIPIVGLNTGRLGFLSRISTDDLESAFKHIEDGNAGIAHRSVIELNSEPSLFGEYNFALNEMTIHKNDSSSMIIIHAYMDGEFLNSYWADGLIVSTPTGSTAYSMSCGGPIVFPGSNNFIITPVAPHNLNVRPIVIPDRASLTFKVEGRSDSFLVSLDSRTEVISSDVQLTVSRHENTVRLIKLPDYSYLKTLRNKLNWGLDKRN